MASLGLNIHIDKENASVQPGLLKGDGLRFGSKNKSLLNHATPRKALYDVNKDNSTLKPTPGGEFLKPSASKPQQQAPKLSLRAENQLDTPQAGKDQSQKKKKLSLQENKIQPKQAGPKSGKPKRQETKVPDPVPEESDGYDSDTIWPRTERLSSHMHKLLSWRPPCLFGSIEDSDSDMSLPEIEEDIPDEVLISEPVMELPDFDLASILADLPDPEKP